MRDLFACEDPVLWRSIHDKYWEVVESKSLGKGKKSGRLLSLDKWYQEELPKAIIGRPDKYVTLSELVKLMDWKLTRGKFRPRLQQLAASNSEESVEKSSRKAFSLLPDTQAAITELSSLKGLGPATASGLVYKHFILAEAVLAAGAPEQAAFMSDEAVESVPGLKPIQYTAKHYSLYLSKMLQRTKRLNKVDGQQDWTPHKLELCLWAWAVANQLQLPFLGEIDAPNLSGEKDESIDSSDDDQRRRKKLRTK